MHDELDLRDRFALAFAAALAGRGGLSDRFVCARAYELAERMLTERARRRRDAWDGDELAPGEPRAAWLAPLDAAEVAALEELAELELALAEPQDELEPAWRRAEGLLDEPTAPLELDPAYEAYLDELAAAAREHEEPEHAAPTSPRPGLAFTRPAADDEARRSG